MVTLDIKKYKNAYQQGVKLMIQTTAYDIYRYIESGTPSFAIIIDKVNVIKPFKTYKEARKYAELHYGKAIPKKRRGNPRLKNKIDFYMKKSIDFLLKIAYNNIKLKAKYYFLFPCHLKVGQGILFYLC